MLRKLFIILFLLIPIFSCGKKSEPKYKESKNQYINQIKIS